MNLNRSFLTLGLGLLSISPIRAEIIQGVMHVKGCEMS